MKGKILLFIYIAAFGVLIYWAYPILKERYFSNENNETSTQQTENGSTVNDNTPTTPNENNPSEENTSENPTDITTPTPNAFLEITRSDCDSECVYFSKEEEKRYCFEACGLNSPVKPANDGCDSLSGLEKDYCWKTEAIEKTDFSICKKIGDSKIREVCQNRVTEDIIDRQKSEL